MKRPKIPFHSFLEQQEAAQVRAIAYVLGVSRSRFIRHCIVQGLRIRLAEDPALEKAVDGILRFEHNRRIECEKSKRQLDQRVLPLETK